MDYDFILSKADGRPMYAQIVEQIKLRIAVGDWPAGFKLPSIRELGVATRVSVITVKRAYQELEAEGLIVTQQGKGSFVAQTEDLGARLMEKDLDELLVKAIDIAKSLGLGLRDVQTRVGDLYGPTPGRKGKRK